jgi:hypothetical protein
MGRPRPAARRRGLGDRSRAAPDGVSTRVRVRSPLTTASAAASAGRSSARSSSRASCC